MSPHFDVLSRATLAFTIEVHRVMHWDLVFVARLMASRVDCRGTMVVMFETLWNARIVVLLSPVRRLDDATLDEDKSDTLMLESLHVFELLVVAMATLPRPFTSPSTRLPRLSTFRLTETTRMTE